MSAHANAEGPEGLHLTHVLKRCCSNCGGTTFQIEDVTGNAGAGEGIYILCQCGKEELITFLTMGATLNYT